MGGIETTQTADGTEAARVATLRGYGILDTPNEPDFDRLVRGLAATFAVPSALVSFIDDQRQWYKARHGVAAAEVPRAISFCTHSLTTDDVIVVPDARVDPRFAANPNVTARDGIRFYAAAPIKAGNGARIGTVCVFDRHPRVDLSRAERAKLIDFADRVTRLLEERRRAGRPAT